jgi:hypothetical protein
MGEVFKALRRERPESGHARRVAEAEGFDQARDLARSFGLMLRQCSTSHYQLYRPGGWLFNIYPGNRRIYRDRERGKAPHLRVSRDDVLSWLARCVMAAAETLQKGGGDADHG